MTSDDKVGGCVKKGQNHDDVILEWPLTESLDKFVHMNRSFAKRIDGSVELHLNSNHDGEITKNVERADMGLFCSIGIIQR